MDPQPNKINTLALKLLPKTYTKNQAIKRLRLIKDFLDYKLFEGNQGDYKQQMTNFKANMMAENNPSLAKELDFVEDLGEEFFNLFNSATLQNELADLQKRIFSGKNLILYLAFEMPEAEVIKMGIWLKTTLGQEVIADLDFDPSLIGGCAISYNGVYKDYSLRERINQHKTEITGILSQSKRA